MRCVPGSASILRRFGRQLSNLVIDRPKHEPRLPRQDAKRAPRDADSESGVSKSTSHVPLAWILGFNQLSNARDGCGTLDVLRWCNPRMNFLVPASCAGCVPNPSRYRRIVNVKTTSELSRFAKIRAWAPWLSIPCGEFRGLSGMVLLGETAVAPSPLAGYKPVPFALADTRALLDHLFSP